MCEFTAPLIGVGFDLSAMYVRRNTRFLSEMDNENLSVNRDYIEIPLNLKYKLSIPAIERIIRPFVTTGPSVAFLTSRKAVNSFLKNKSCDVAWNFGFGVELFSKVQVAASYGLGLTKSLEAVGVMDNGVDIDVGAADFAVLLDELGIFADVFNVDHKSDSLFCVRTAEAGRLL